MTKDAENTTKVAVYLTSIEMAAVSRATFAVTTNADQPVVNAAERALQKLREAAANQSKRA